MYNKYIDYQKQNRNYKKKKKLTRTLKFRKKKIIYC